MEREESVPGTDRYSEQQSAVAKAPRRFKLMAANGSVGSD